MLTYEKAKIEAETLLNFIELVNKFDIKSIEDLIIYQYALHNSISKVIKSVRLNEMNLSFTINQDLVNTSFVKDTILSKPQNELHSLIKSGYLKKTKPRRKIQF